jgi:sugar fermentation stimulation protein A
MTTNYIQNETPSPSKRIKLDFGTLIPAAFLRRENRFVVQVEYQGEVYQAHMANPGRLQELLTPRRTLWIHPVHDPGRKTQFDVVLADLDDTLVSMNSQLPNQLVAAALHAGSLPGLLNIQSIEREVTRGHSRIDFMVQEKLNVHWVEVKSVTLVANGTARFPDAPTQRGTRHLQVLQEIVAEGERATVLFVIQREDAQAFTPHDERDPAFGAALRAAADAGVNVRALRCRITYKSIQLGDEVPVCLDSPIL